MAGNHCTCDHKPSVPSKYSSCNCDSTDLFYSLFSVLFSLRIYALCGRNKVILTIALIMIIARLAVDTWVSSYSEVVNAKETAHPWFFPWSQVYTLSVGISMRGTQYDMFSICGNEYNLSSYDRWVFYNISMIPFTLTRTRIKDVREPDVNTRDQVTEFTLR